MVKKLIKVHVGSSTKIIFFHFNNPLQFIDSGMFTIWLLQS